MTWEGVMGEENVYEVCYEGDLTLEVSDALQRLGAEPNFDQSWKVRVESNRTAATLVRYLRMRIGAHASLLVAKTNFSRSRDYLLVRHSTTPGADYRELHGALERLGIAVEIPFEATFVLKSDSATDTKLLGEALSQLCPDDSLMVMGITSDVAFCTSGLHPFVVSLDEQIALEPRFSE